MPKIRYIEKTPNSNCKNLIARISEMYLKYNKDLSSFELRTILAILREIEKYNQILPCDKRHELDIRFAELQRNHFQNKR